MQPRAASRQIRLSLACEPGVPPVRTDARQIVLILTELVENAVKYVPTGGEVECAASMSDGVPRITVSDTGPGFTAEDLPQVFEPFYRGEAANRSQVKGTGLGLAIAARTAALLGVTLTAGSRPGGGAVVDMAFSPPPETETPARSSEDTATISERG
jgi:signal transduction histidine kinase